MVRYQFHVVLVIASTLLLTPSLVGQERKTYPLFSLDSPVTLDSLAHAPFPSDWYTVPDDTQNTGRRVSLPGPDCGTNISDCEDLAFINELDGFNLQPRLSIPFSDPIEPISVTSETIFLVSLGSTLPDPNGMPCCARVGIDQVVWDTLTNTLHVESDELLDQHTRYVLVVTKDVRDAAGQEIKAAKEFLHFVDDDVTESTGDPNLDTYRTVLRGALMELDTHRIIPRGQVVAASVFTTQSATAVLEKIRHQIHNATPAPADFRLLGPNTAPTVFNLNDVQLIKWTRQTKEDPNAPMAFVPANINSPFPANVASIAFGKYLSPDYEFHAAKTMIGVPSEYIPPVGTRSGTPLALGTNEIYFNVFLPSVTPDRPKPVSGWPVAIVAPGMGGSKDGRAGMGGAGDLLPLVDTLSEHGVASIAINAVGHGFGPESTLTVVPKVGFGNPVTFRTGGRSIDQDGNGMIQGFEGIVTTSENRRVAKYAVGLYSDGFRQTAADLMQLVRVIEVGMDVDGDGQPDLDASHIYYFGTSLGGGYGTVFVTVEPDVRVAAFSTPVTPAVVAPLSVAQRDTLGAVLAARTPSLLNAPGIKAFNAPATNVEDLVPLAEPSFDDNFPLRDQIPLAVQLADGRTRNIPPDIQSSVSNDVVGAMAIQEVEDKLEWAGQAGSPIAYAPHLRKEPLTGVAPKSVLFHIAKGDQSAPNPTTTALVRAGELADRAMYYRHDLAYADGVVTEIDTNPHGFTFGVVLANIAPQAKEQVAKFFASDGIEIIQPEPSQYFELFPLLLPLPEDLNYIPMKK
jgi:hypothetical protein